MSNHILIVSSVKELNVISTDNLTRHIGRVAPNDMNTESFNINWFWWRCYRRDTQSQQALHESLAELRC